MFENTEDLVIEYEEMPEVRDITDLFFLFPEDTKGDEVL